VTRQQVKKWLVGNGYHEVETGLYIREPYYSVQICNCRFSVGGKTLFYEVRSRENWIIAEAADFKTLSINSKKQLAGMQIGIFSL
jgi:hypothetical protein